jgi:hypothetical protein
MTLKMQVSNPVIQIPDVKKVEDLSEAIEAIFPLATEDAILYWNWIPVRISYKYDLSVLITDLIFMLESLTTSDKGNYEVHFGSSSFRAQWKLSWKANVLTITSNWDSISGNYEDLLNKRNQLEVSRSQFLDEWKALLRKVIESVEQSGVEIEDKHEINALRKIEASIASFGNLYATVN